MYVASGLQHLSEAQIKKLIKGEPVRVKAGSHHKVHLSHEQHKKLHKAHSKGAGITLQLDPYQCDAHHHLIGEGFLSKAKALASRAISGAKKAFAMAPAGVKAALKEKALESLRHGAERFAPQIEQRLGKIGSEAFSHGYDLAQQQVHHFGEPEMQNEIIGSGMHKVHRGRPRKHPVGGALKMRDFREGAKKFGRAVGRVGQRVTQAVAPVLGGIAGAEFGPMGSMIGSRLASAVTGSGMHKGRGRPRKIAGGALYPAGFGGGLLPSEYGASC